MSFENRYEPLPEGPYIDMVDIYADQIIEAIEDVVIVQFDYKGFHRIVEPYELGQTILGDNLLRGFQIAGEAFGRRVEGWKLFRLDYISTMEVSAEEFPIRGEYADLPPFWTYVPIIVLPGGPEKEWIRKEIPSKRKSHPNVYTGAEHMAYEVDYKGISFYFDELSRASAAAKEAILSSSKFPEWLREHITTVQLVEETFAGDVAVNAKVIDGFMTIFNNTVISPGVLAHEMSHKLATKKWGDPFPAEGSDYLSAIESGEPAVSSYAKTDTAEDFGEAVRLYVDNPEELKKTAPLRHVVIDRLMKDPNYGG